MPLRVSAGVLPYRHVAGRLEALLVHPGGPLYAHRDEGCWSIAKGGPEPGESWLQTASRELREETGMILAPSPEWIALSWVRQKGGKIVHAWAAPAGSAQPDLARTVPCRLEWPPATGQWIEFPEVDQARFFALEVASRKIKLAQVPLLRRLAAHFHQDFEP